MKGKIILLLILGILLIGVVSATTTCCEKTNTGAWCQNVNDASLCEDSINPITGQPYRAVSSFCEATSYCKLGTCINQQEGTCISAPQIVCQKENGYWSSSSQDKLPQCALGCCLIGDQAAFVTSVACNRMTALYGLEVNYRADITSELSCLASANPGAEGACVFSKEGVNNCERTTRKECQERETSSQEDYSFHEGFLCSAQEIETICAKSQSTICHGDDVYFVDTCGNLANIYDATKINNQNYWSYINTTGGVGNGAGNINSPTYGNCDYYSGSMCSDKGTKSVSYGNYICKSLDCEDYTGTYSYFGQNVAGRIANKPLHGDTWCATDNRTDGTTVGSGATSPGSTYFRLICYNGEVTTEECDGTRQKICSENSSTRTGNCKVNIWQDCVNQTTKDSCENADVRDCKWVTTARANEYDYTGFAETITQKMTNFLNYGFSNGGLTDDSSISSANGACVSKYPTGFERDGSNNVVGSEVCSLASSNCVVTYTQANAASVGERLGFGSGGWVCHKNCECAGCKQGDTLDKCTSGNAWASKLNGICTQMGDCGVKKNYIGDGGINTLSNSLSVAGCLEGGNNNRCA